MKSKLIFCLALVLSGCSTQSRFKAGNRPSDLPIVYHNAQYDFSFFLPADWQGYSVLKQAWQADLRSADYQRVIGKEHGPMIVLRNPRWTLNDPYPDIPILVFTRSQWEFVEPERLFIGAGGSDYEISHNAKFVFGINSRAVGWDDALKEWGRTGQILQKNVAAGEPHLFPDK